VNLKFIYAAIVLGGKGKGCVIDACAEFGEDMLLLVISYNYNECLLSS
jgi:hypothetical protein